MTIRKNLVFISIGLCLLTLFLAYLSFQSIAGNNAKYLKGDGYEYILMTESLANHLTPDLRLNDVTSLYSRINALTHTSPDNYRFFAYADMLKKGTNYVGFFKTADHQYYSYHFWFYPLLNVPALYLTKVFNLSPVYCFLITHSIIFFLASLFLLTATGFTIRQRAFIFAFYLFSGVTYYFNWYSPELLTASLLLCGLLLLLQKKPIASAFLLALAAQQNPPIGLIAFGILIYQSLKIIHAKRSLKNTIRQFLLIAGVTFILSASPLFYLIHYGTPSLIIADGYSKTHLITQYRLFSLFFDINQGMIVAIPSVLLVFALSFVFIISKVIYQHKLSDATKKTIFTVLLMLMMTLMLAIPSLSAPNWNCGMSVFLRYACWTAMPIGVAMMVILNTFSKRIFYILFAFILAIQIPILFSFSITGDDAYLSHKKIAIYVMNNKPDWYNPVPVIFVARGLQKDIFVEHKPVPETDVIYFHVNQSQHSVRKILYNTKNIKTVLPFCQNKTIAELTQITKPVTTENNWEYLNLPVGLCQTSLSQGLHEIK